MTPEQEMRIVALTEANRLAAAITPSVGNIPTSHVLDMADRYFDWLTEQPTPTPAGPETYPIGIENPRIVNEAELEMTQVIPRVTDPDHYREDCPTPEDGHLFMPKALDPDNRKIVEWCKICGYHYGLHHGTRVAP